MTKKNSVIILHLLYSLPYLLLIFSCLFLVLQMVDDTALKELGTYITTHIYPQILLNIGADCENFSLFSLHALFLFAIRFALFPVYDLYLNRDPVNTLFIMIYDGVIAYFLVPYIAVLPDLFYPPDSPRYSILLPWGGVFGIVGLFRTSNKRWSPKLLPSGDLKGVSDASK